MRSWKCLLHCCCSAALEVEKKSHLSRVSVPWVDEPLIATFNFEVCWIDLRLVTVCGVPLQSGQWFAMLQPAQ